MSFELRIKSYELRTAGIEPGTEELESASKNKKSTGSVSHGGFLWVKVNEEERVFCCC